MVRHRAAFGGVVALLLLGATGCQPDVLATGARPAPGGEVELLFRSCREVPLRVSLEEARGPVRVDPGPGTTPNPEWTTTWEGRVGAGATSTHVPVVLELDRWYRASVGAADPGDRLGVDSEPLVFLATDLSDDGVVTSRPAGGLPVPPEVFVAANESTCAGPFAAVVRPVALGVGVVACLVLVPILGIIVLAARARRAR